MKDQAKSLLTLRGTLSCVARVEEYLTKMIEDGNTELEEKIISSGKNINDCWKYITFKAKQEATSENGSGMSACIDDATVFGWAVHYYEDNASAELEMNPPKPKVEKKTETKADKAKKDKETSPEENNSVDVDQVTFGEATDIPTETKEEPSLEETQKEEVIPEEAPMDLSFDDVVVPHINGEDRKCVICGKLMKDAYVGKPVESIRRWTDNWLNEFGVVFCCKEHKEEFLKLNSSEVK